MDEIVQQQDALRTKRAFISFLSTAFGVDQTLSSTDAYAVNTPRQYQTIGPGGLVGVEGTSSSNGQTVAVVTSPLVLLALAVGVYLIWKN